MSNAVTLKSPLAVPYWRQLLKGPPIDFDEGGVKVRAEVGDFIEAALVLRSPSELRNRLGPPVKTLELGRRFKVAPDEFQLVYRPPGRQGDKEPPIPVASGVPVGTFAIIHLEVGARIWPLKQSLNLTEHEAFLLVDEHVEGDFAQVAGLLAETMAKTGAGIVFPAMNLSDPTSLPVQGDQGSSLPRLPAGRSIYELAELLAKSDLQPVRAWPVQPGAVLLRRDIVERVVGGERISAIDSCTDPRAFLYREKDQAGQVASLLDTQGGRSDEWPQTALLAAEVAAGPIEGRPPVVFYSTNVGPWGGVAVLFRVADELQRLGFHAFVLHQTSTPHAMKPRTAPLKVWSQAVVSGDWPRLVGHEQGFLVASHWASGKLCREVARRWPGVVLTTIVQDREDMFETPDGKPVHPRHYEDFIAIGRGASVSRWIVDTMAEDFGVDPKNYEIIPNGVDMKVFKPGVRFEQSVDDYIRPIRILSMWRPQTAVRRGIKLLREVYEALHAEHGDNVSLEVFGWNAPDGIGKAPPWVVHHGHLSPPQVAGLMAEVDIFVEPSKYQGWGLPGSEALACGAALVSTACRGPADYIQHGENALMVPHAELHAAVNAVIKDASLRNRLRAAAPSSVKQFDWPLVGARYALYLCKLAKHEASMSAWTKELGAIEARALAVLAAGA